MKRSILLCIYVMLLSLNGLAKTIEWSISPEYDDLKPYSEGIYYCNKGRKWGLISVNGRIILYPQYDFITSMTSGYAIAGVKDGTRNRISCILNESFATVNLSETYYLVNKYYTYFSEGKMPVANKAGKQGFINTSGNIVVKCQFDNVHPFSEGFASVAKHPYAYYITDNYDRNPNQSVLPIDFNYGEVTFATTFYKGTAVVAYNNKAAVINTAGKKIGNYKGSINSSCYNKFDYTIKGCGSVSKESTHTPTNTSAITAYIENGLYGFRQDGITISYPAFTGVGTIWANGYATATFNGKMGLLHFVEGDISSFIAKANNQSPISGAFTASTDGKIDKCDYVLKLPATASTSDYSIYLDNGNGESKLTTANLTNGVLKAQLTPTPTESKGKTVTISATVNYKGIPVHKYSKSFAIEYPAVAQPTATQSHYDSHLRISGPATQSERANEKDIQIVSATISNHTGKSVTTVAKLSIPSKNMLTEKTLTIPNGSSKTISLSVTVLRNETTTSTVSLSTGESSSKQIKLGSYY